jgi:uncharacterized protein YkwD
VIAVAVVVIIVFALLPLSHILFTFQTLAQDAISDDRQTQETRTESSPSTPQSERENTPTPIRVPTLFPQASVIELQQYALDKINKDRADFGLQPVALSENQAAQIHAEDVFQTHVISHWMTNGEKPHMTYSRLGGYGAVGQNVATQGYDLDAANSCRVGLASCMAVDAKGAIDRAQYRMMYDDAHADWGHRDNILDKNHTHVSIGVAHDRYFFAFVQNFENNYVDWAQPITYNDNTGDVSMRGTLEEGMTFRSINIFYDPLPTAQVYEEHKDESSYGLGEFVAIAVAPPPPGSYYEETGEFVLVTGKEWRLNDEYFDIRFSMDKAYSKYGDGVYTVITRAENDGETVEVTTTAMIIER